MLSHRFVHPTVRELPRKPVDIVDDFLAVDWRVRAEQIAAQDAQRRAIIGKPSK